MDAKTSGDTRIGYEWIALSVTTIGALMAAIDASAVIIALPTIMADLQADFITIMWVLLSYMLILAALVPVIGRLADMLGRKNLYNLGFIIFTVGSLLCGLSQQQFHGWDLVGYRMVQGVGGALLITNSAVIVTDAFRGGTGRLRFGGERDRVFRGVPPWPGRWGGAHVDFVAIGVSNKRPNWHYRHDMEHNPAQRASGTS
jgi:MFS family permease